MNDSHGHTNGVVISPAFVTTFSFERAGTHDLEHQSHVGLRRLDIVRDVAALLLVNTRDAIPSNRSAAAPFRAG